MTKIPSHIAFYYAFRFPPLPSKFRLVIPGQHVTSPSIFCYAKNYIILSTIMLLLSPVSALLRRCAAASAPASASASASLAVGSSSALPSAWGLPVLPAFAFGGSIQTRNSTKRGGGSTKNNKNSPGKRLGFKKVSGQAVLAGQIIYRQRGTSWHAGPNCGIGRDHTIFATAPGYIHYFYSQHTPILPKRAKESTTSVKLPIQKLERTTYSAKELATKPHPSSKKTVRRYIAVSPNPLTTFPRPQGAPRERLFHKIDSAMLQSHIDQIKSQTESSTS